jgi:hypothetical protein
MDTTNEYMEDNMKNITCKLSLAIIVCATLCLGCTYTYTEVLPPGWRNAHATSINDNGDVAGWGRDGTGTFKGFVYSGGNYTELLPPGWSRSIEKLGFYIASQVHTYCINNKGTVVIMRIINRYVIMISLPIIKSFIATHAK